MPPREKRPDLDRLILKMSPEAEKRCRELMAQITRTQKGIEKKLGKNDKRREEKHKKKMAWYDRFDRSIEKMYGQMLTIEARMKRNRLAQKKDRVRSARPHRRTTS